MKQRTKAQWQALIEEHAQSGLTAVEFCRQRSSTINILVFQAKPFKGRAQN